MRRWLIWLLIFGLFGAAALYPAEAPTALSPALQAYLKLPENEINLGKGALLICKEEYPNLDVGIQLKTLDGLGARLLAATDKAGTVHGKLAALKKLLFEEEKYQLPKKDSLSDFLLSDVLKYKRGNCLGLSVLCLALAERSGLQLHGVPVPSRLTGSGHLLVRYDDGVTRLNFDPTQGGAAQSDEYYRESFKLRPEDLKDGYILGNATRKDVLCLLLVNLGGARVSAKRALEALPLLEAALALKPAYAPAYNNLGAARLSLGDVSSAEQAWQKTLALQAGFSGARLGLAEIALRRGNADAAEKEIKAVLAEEPDSLNAKSLLANVHAARKEWAAATALMAEVAKATPLDAQPLCNLGKLHALSGDYQAAESAYREALAVDNKDADVHFGLGLVLRATGQFDAADDEFAAALKLDPHHVPTLLGDANAAFTARKFDIAESGFAKVLLKEPANLDALIGLWHSLLAQKKMPEAAKFATTVAKLQPDNPSFVPLLAETKMFNGDMQGAINLLEKTMEKVPEADKPPFLLPLGLCYGHQNSHKKAFDIAQQLLKINPNDIAALRLAANASEGLQNKEQAVGFYRRLLALDPNDAAALKALARLGAK